MPILAAANQVSLVSFYPLICKSTYIYIHRLYWFLSVLLQFGLNEVKKLFVEYIGKSIDAENVCFLLQEVLLLMDMIPQMI